MNAYDILIAAAACDFKPAVDAWREGNNAGRGYAPDLGELGPPWHVARNSGEVDIYQDGEDVVLVGDAHGAWAVRVRGSVASLVSDLSGIIDLDLDSDGRAWTSDGSAGVAIDESGRIVILDRDGVPCTHDGSGRVDTAARAAREILRLRGVK